MFLKHLLRANGMNTQNYLSVNYIRQNIPFENTSVHYSGHHVPVTKKVQENIIKIWIKVFLSYLVEKYISFTCLVF